MEHANIDPITGACLDCGATREEIQDRIFPECRRVHGPYRQGIIVLRAASARLEFEASKLRRSMEQHEAMAVHCQHAMREAEACKREVDASLVFLGDVLPAILQRRD